MPSKAGIAGPTPYLVADSILGSLLRPCNAFYGETRAGYCMPGTVSGTMRLPAGTCLASFPYTPTESYSREGDGPFASRRRPQEARRRRNTPRRRHVEFVLQFVLPTLPYAHALFWEYLTSLFFFCYHLNGGMMRTIWLWLIMSCSGAIAGESDNQ